MADKQRPKAPPSPHPDDKLFVWEITMDGSPDIMISTPDDLKYALANLVLGGKDPMPLIIRRDAKPVTLSFKPAFIKRKEYDITDAQTPTEN